MGITMTIHERQPLRRGRRIPSRRELAGSASSGLVLHDGRLDDEPGLSACTGLASDSAQVPATRPDSGGIDPRSRSFVSEVTCGAALGA